MLIFLALSLVQILNMLNTFAYLTAIGLGCALESMLLRFAIHAQRCWDAPNLEQESPLMYRFLQSNQCEDNQELWNQFLHG